MGGKAVPKRLLTWRGGDIELRLDLVDLNGCVEISIPKEEILLDLS